MREVLAGYFAAVEESAGARLATLRSDLEVVAAALVRHEDLRRVLTDPGLAVATRRAVLRDLLEGKALPESVDLLSFTLGVERAGELPVVVGQLVNELADEERAGASEAWSGVRTGRAAGRQRLRGFAERVLQELGAAGEVDEVEDELFRFARILDDERQLRAALADPQAPLAGRMAVLDDLLASKVRPATLRLARFALASGQQRDLVGTFSWLAALAAEERGRRLAEVRSAVDVGARQQHRLAAALGRLVDRPVEVRVVRDDSVVGGVLVTVGDLVIDGTLRMRLDRLREALTQPS